MLSVVPSYCSLNFPREKSKEESFLRHNIVNYYTLKHFECTRISKTVIRLICRVFLLAFVTYTNTLTINNLNNF